MESRESLRWQMESLLAAKAKVVGGMGEDEDFARYWQISDNLEKQILDELAKS